MTGPRETQSPPAVWFAYSPDRKGEHPQAHLSEFTGTLQADGYAGFDAVYEGGRVKEAACWAHVRRKFYDLQVAHKSPVAQEALERIAALYAIEEEIRGRPAEERREVRNARSRPLLESLKQWLEETLGKLSQKSDTTKAIRYALGRWDALTALLRRWPSGNRQQCRGTFAARRRFGSEKLFLRRFGYGRRTRRRYLQPDRHSKTQRSEPGSVLARGALTHRRPPYQPHRGTAALESRCRTHGKLTPRSIVNYSTSRRSEIDAYRQTTTRTLKVFSRYFVAPGVCVGFLLLWPFLIQVRPYQFKRSLQSASAATRDFFDSSFLYKWTGDIYSPSLGALPLTVGSWQKRVTDVGIYVLLPMVFLFVLMTLIVITRSADETRKRQTAHCHLFGGAALTSIALTVLLHLVLRVDYPMARFCLYEIPFFTLSVMLSFRELSYRFPRLHLNILGFVLAAIVLTDYGLSLNTKYFRYNAYDVFSRQLFLRIAQDAQAHGLTNVRIGGTWWYEPEMNFYRRRYKADWMKPYDVKDKSYFWESPGALQPAAYNYYLFIPANDPGLAGPRVRTIFQDPTTHLIVIALDK